MLDSYEHRKGISLSFGLVASLCLNVLLSNYERLYGVDISIAISEWPAFTQSKSLASFLPVVYTFFVTLTNSLSMKR